MPETPDLDAPNDLKSLLREPLRQLQTHVHGRLVSVAPELRPAHANVLQYLPLEGGRRVQELASRAQMTWQSMGELVQQLEEAGYVERAADPSDGRARQIRLTASGRALVPVAYDAMREVEAHWASQIGPEELNRLRETLRRLWPAAQESIDRD